MDRESALMQEAGIVSPARLTSGLDPAMGRGEYLPLLNDWALSYPPELFGFQRSQSGSFLEARLQRPGTKISLFEQYGGLIRAEPGDPQEFRAFASIVKYVGTEAANLSFLEGLRQPVGNLWVVSVPAGGDLLYIDKQRKWSTGRSVPPAYPVAVEQALTNAVTEAIFGLPPHEQTPHVFDQFVKPYDLVACEFYLPGRHATDGNMLKTFANTAFTRSGFSIMDGEHPSSTGEMKHVRRFSRINQRMPEGWKEVNDPSWQLNSACMPIWVDATLAAKRSLVHGQPLTNTDPQILAQMKQLGQR